LPDQAQNLITCSLCHARHTLIISERSIHNFLSYLANRQTNRQTNKNRQKHNLLGGSNECAVCVCAGAMGKVGAGDENAGVLDLSLKQSSNSDYKPACNIHGVGNDVRTASSSTVLFSPSTTVSLASPVDGDNNIVRDDADRNGKVSCCAASMATAVTAAATAALFSHSSVVTTPGGRVPSLTCTATATAAGLPLFCGVSTSSPTSERTTFTDSKTTCGPTG